MVKKCEHSALEIGVKSRFAKTEMVVTHVFF